MEMNFINRKLYIYIYIYIYIIVMGIVTKKGEKLNLIKQNQIYNVLWEIYDAFI